MSSFTKPLIITPIDEKYWKLVEPFEYVLGHIDGDYCVKIHRGFETDFASIPRVFWRILPPWDRYGKAAIVHDALYSNNIILHRTFDCPEKISRKRCDEIFLEAMEVLEVPKWKRIVMFKCVRWFGKKAWDDHRRQW